MAESDIYTEIYGLRVLVFLELEPQSNKYQQVMLDADQFKKVSMAMSVATGREIRDGIDEAKTYLSEETYELPDLKEINEHEVSDLS